ncbi:hypothetical protein BKA93DRAFT_754665 [Sparassis latifolia]
MVAGSDNEYGDHDLALSVADCKDIDHVTAEAFAMLSVASLPSRPARRALGGFTSAQRQHSSPREATMRCEPQLALLDAGPLHHPICEGPLDIPVEVNGKKIYQLEEACETGITDHWYKAAAMQFYRGAKFYSSPVEEKKYDSAAAPTHRYREGPAYMLRGWRWLLCVAAHAIRRPYQKREYLEDACAIRGFVATLPPAAKLECTPYSLSSIGINTLEDRQGPHDVSLLSSPTSVFRMPAYSTPQSPVQGTWQLVVPSQVVCCFLWDSPWATAKRMTSGHPIGFFKEFDTEEDAVGEFILVHSLGHIIALA